MSDSIYRHDAIKAIETSRFLIDAIEKVMMLPTAQPDASEDTCEIERKSNDLISREYAIRRFGEDGTFLERDGVTTISLVDAKQRAVDLLQSFPAQQERTGRWILVKGSDGKDYHKCSWCLHIQDITGVKNYCAVCGADMIGEQE